MVKTFFSFQTRGLSASEGLGWPLGKLISLKLILATCTFQSTGTSTNSRKDWMSGCQCTGTVPTASQSGRGWNMRTVGRKFATSGVSTCSLLLAGPSLLLFREILAAEDELKSAAVAGSKGHSTSTTSRLGCLRKCQFAALLRNLSERQSSRGALISQAFSSFSFFFAGWKSIWMGVKPEALFAKGRFAE